MTGTGSMASGDARACPCKRAYALHAHWDLQAALIELIENGVLSPGLSGRQYKTGAQ